MTKISKIFETKYVNKFSRWREQLEAGELEKVEKEIQALLQQIFVVIMGMLLTQVGTSKVFKNKLKKEYGSKGVSDLRQRENRIQLITGDWVYYKSYYARDVNKSSNLSTRHLSELYWGCIRGASPSYASLVSIYSVMCPSFEVGRKILSEHSIVVNRSRMRELSLSMGELGQKIGIEGILLPEESLKGKRVVASYDGGRSRTRQSKKTTNSRGNTQYHTKWREPKIIVIHVLDEQGELERKKVIPFYYGTLRTTKVEMKKLKEALILLNAKQAEIVQFISDGALCIWSQIEGVITGAGIDLSKVEFTLDYYHAVEHLKGLSKLLGGNKKKQKVVFLEWKPLLWEGDMKAVIEDFKERLKKAKKEISKKMQTAMNYFIRHEEHMNYKELRERKLLCGSGLVESAVRRIINLRFKGPSTFWKVENLEKLILLRCVFLAGRWDNMLTNIHLAVKKCDTI